MSATVSTGSARADGAFAPAALFARLLAGDTPPFAFDLAGRAFFADATPLPPADAPSPPSHAPRVAPVVRRLAWRHAETGLRVAQEIRHDPAHALLTLTLALVAERATPIDHVRLLDVDLGPADAPAPVLHGFNGGAQWLHEGDFPRRDWAPRVWPLGREKFRLHSGGDGRCSVQFFPVWWLQSSDAGLWFGPEWSGTWSLETRLVDGHLRLLLGLPRLDFTLAPGETLALPPLTLGLYAGDIDAGHAAFRRVVRDHLRPPPPASRPYPPITYNVIGGPVSCFDPAGLRKETALLQDLGFECFSWASCWQRPTRGSNNFWEALGNFEPAADRFPDGIRAFSEDLRALGMLHGLWFDPRAAEGSRLWREADAAGALVRFTENIEKDKFWALGLIDAGHPAGRALLVDLLETFITRHGASWLWHDLNVELRQRYWEEHEKPARRGIAELAYHQGWFSILDEIRARHPEVFLLWCGSGGTMINIGTLRRADAHWVSDHESLDRLPDGRSAVDTTHGMRTALARIFPASLIVNALLAPKAPDGRYGEPPLSAFVSQLGALFSVGIYLHNWPRTALDRLRSVLEVYRDIRPLLDADFEPLFPFPQTRADWDGWHYRDPVTGRGVVMLIRLSASEETRATVRLRDVDPAATRFTLRLGEATLRPALDKDDGTLLVHLPVDAAVFTYKPAC